jgi:hypothetical protein
MNNYGKICGVLNKNIDVPDDAIRNKMKQKLLDENSYYKFMSSRHLIKNNMKKWELEKDSIKVAKTKQTDDSLLEGGPQKKEEEQTKHRNMKLGFFLTQKSESYTSISEVDTLKPHLANLETTKRIAFELNGDLYINIEHELKLHIFAWPSVPDLMKEENLIGEFTRFQDSCEQVFRDLMIEISGFPKIPLMFKIKRRADEYERDNMLNELENEQDSMTRPQDSLIQRDQPTASMNVSSNRSPMNADQPVKRGGPPVILKPKTKI